MGEADAHEKAAGVLDTPATASNQQCASSLSTADTKGNPKGKDFATLQALFALLGRELTLCHRAHDGRISYAVTRWGESRYFTHLHDVGSYLVQIGRTA